MYPSAAKHVCITILGKKNNPSSCPILTVHKATWDSAAAAAAMSEQMLPNKLISRQKGADQTSFLRLNRATAAPVTLNQICPPSFHFNCSGNNSIGQAGFNFKWCKSCKKMREKKIAAVSAHTWTVSYFGTRICSLVYQSMWDKKCFYFSFNKWCFGEWILVLSILSKLFM